MEPGARSPTLLAAVLDKVATPWRSCHTHCTNLFCMPHLQIFGGHQAWDKHLGDQLKLLLARTVVYEVQQQLAACFASAALAHP